MKFVGETRAHVGVYLKDEEGQVQTLCASFGGGREGNRGGGIIIINNSGGALGTHDGLVIRTESNSPKKNSATVAAILVLNDRSNKKKR